MAMPAETRGSITVMMLIIYAIALCISFLPSILAVLKGNIYKGQVIKYQLLIVLANVLISLAITLVSKLFKLAAFIVSIVGGIWSLISIILWFYILIHAFKDTEMTLLSKFGINI